MSLYLGSEGINVNIGDGIQHIEEKTFKRAAWEILRGVVA